MEAQPPQFTGPPCGQYKTHTFYGGFKYSNKQGKSKDVKLGDFFFVRISAEEDPCIGELQLLCSNRNNDQQLSALRLYFLPEQTPDGRLAHHGEDEVLVASDRVVLKLEDLVGWITEEVEWNHGIIAPRAAATSPLSATPSEVSSDDTIVIKKEEKDESLPSNDDNNNDTSSAPSRNSDEIESSGAVVDEEKVKPVEVKEEIVKDVACQDEDDTKETKVLVLSYQSYCRYRTILRRLDGGDTKDWLQNDLVLALGGFEPPSYKTHVLFCREMFEHDELAHHELNCEYLAPVIKGKRKKKKPKTRSTSPDSIASEEFKDMTKSNQKVNGLKQPPIKNEQEFLQRLFKFMKKRNTPIHRVPHLGFKQIDLYVFYSFAQKLGGYDAITGKKLWKHVYDELGGNPGSTSAATCTRRHYERLLLPFERFMAGIIYKPVQRGKKSQKKLDQEDGKEDSETALIKAEPSSDANSEALASANHVEVEDAYTFTDSNHENSNSKDSNSNEFNSACEEQPLTNEAVFSDEDSKTIWSIQKQPDTKDEVDKDDSKPIKPLIIQVRQSRSSRGSKTPVPDGSPSTQEKLPAEPVKLETISPPLQPIKVKSENDTASEKSMPVLLTQQKMVANSEVFLPNKHSPSKFLPPAVAPEVCDAKIKVENHGQRKRGTAKTSSGKKYAQSSNKVEYHENKSWCSFLNNSDQSPYHSSAHPGIDSYVPSHLRGQASVYYKAGTRSEPDITRDHLLQTGRHSVGSMSASSVASVEASANDEKLSVPQRRPSVIQHTEYAATSPSPSTSPKQSNPEMNQNICPKDGVGSVPFSSPKLNLLPSQPSYSMTGKVAEWLTKGVHEVVACKTPSTAIEKVMELHDKVMMPSSCKTPGAVGTSKIPVNNVKSKHNSSAGNTSKSPRSKYSSSHRHRNSDAANVNSNTQPRGNVAHQKPLHPTPTPYNSVMSNASSIPKGAAKYHHPIPPNLKHEFYPNGPYFNQPKRHKMNNMVPTMLPPVTPRPSPSPFVRQQTYVTPPLSDLPKMTASTHNDYEFAVLDLSVRKKPVPAPKPRTPIPVVPLNATPIPEEGVCLDLSLKKKSNVSTDNGIENITPPLPLSPNPASQQTAPYMHTSLKPLPTLLALQDMAAEEAARKSGYSSDRRNVPPIMSSTVTTQVSGPPIGMPPTMFPGSTHSKLPPGLMNSIPPGAYSKDIAKNMYMPSNARHSQFSPYVIPPFFPSNWTSVVNTSSPSVKQTNNSQTSPMAYKGMVNHSVFPKDYPYNVKSQYHPVLCKDSGRYPSSGK